MEPASAGPGQPRCDDAVGRRGTAAANPGATAGSNGGGELEEEAAARATALHDFVAYLKTNGLAEEDFTVDASAIPRHFRVNPLFDAAADPDVVAKGGLLPTLAQDFGGARPCLLQWLPASCQVYEIDAAVNLTASELFTRKAHGRWNPAVYGIDASSCAAAVALAPRPGDHVLDLCCAPGAKLTLLANLMHHRGTLTGVDLSTERLRPTWKMLVRYGVADAHSGEGRAEGGGSTMSGGSGDGNSKVDTNPWHLRVFQGDGTTFALGPPPIPSAARADRGDSDGSGSGGGSGGDGSGAGDDDSGRDLGDGGSGSGNATAGCGIDGAIGGGGNDGAGPLLILDSRERAAWPPRTRMSLKMNRAARASMVAAEAGVAARAAQKATTHALLDGGTDRKRARVGSDAQGSKCCSNGRDDASGGGGGSNGEDEAIVGFGDMESEAAAPPQPPPPPSPPPPPPPPQSLYDRVLVDAECTHDGSVRHITKFRDWGWHTFAARVLDPQRLRELPVTQRGLLLNGFRLLRPGGTLVYATCSLCRAQNEDVVEWFLSLPEVRACRGTRLVPIEFEGATAPIPARACVGTAQLAAAAASVAPAASSSSSSPQPQSMPTAAASAAAGAGASDALRHCLRFSPRVSRTSGLFVAKFVKGDRPLASTVPDGVVAETPRRALQGAMKSP